MANTIAGYKVDNAQFELWDYQNNSKVFSNIHLRTNGNLYVNTSGNLVGASTYVRGNLIMNDTSKSLSVAGTSDFTGNVTASNNVTVSGKLSATGNVDSSGNLNVTGQTYLTGNVSASNNVTVSGTLSATGNVNSSGNLNVTGQTYLTGNVSASNNVTVSGTLSASGNVNSSGNLNVTGQTYLTGNVSASNNVTVSGTLSASGNVNSSGNLNVTGLANVSGSLSVSGQSTFTGAVSMSNTLGVTGNINASSNVNVSSNLVVSGTAILNSIQTSGGLSTSGVTNFTNTTNSTNSSNGAVVISGGMGVAKTVNIGEGLNVSSYGTIGGGLTVNNGATLNGGVSLNNGAGVYGGALDIGTPTNTALYVSGGIYASERGYIANTNQTTTEGTGAFIVKGGVSVAKDLYVGGNLRIEGNTTFVNTDQVTVEDPLISLNQNNNLAFIQTQGGGLNFYASDSTEADNIQGYLKTTGNGQDLSFKSVNTSINGIVTVKPHASLNSDVLVSNVRANADQRIFNSNLIIDNKLALGGASVTAGNTLSVTGNASISSRLTLGHLVLAKNDLATSAVPSPIPAINGSVIGTVNGACGTIYANTLNIINTGEIVNFRVNNNFVDSSRLVFVNVLAYDGGEFVPIVYCKSSNAGSFDIEVSCPYTYVNGNLFIKYLVV